MIYHTFQYYKTPLHLARNGKVAQLLLQSGADVNVKDLVNRIINMQFTLLLLVMNDIIN